VALKKLEEARAKFHSAEVGVEQHEGVVFLFCLMAMGSTSNYKTWIVVV
jgi:hypothetical protein